MNNILEICFRALTNLDASTHYQYETAPYCGHSFSGHKGFFTESAYHEGIGYAAVYLGLLWIYKNSEETSYHFGIRPLRTMVFEPWRSLCRTYAVSPEELSWGVKRRFDLPIHK